MAVDNASQIDAIANDKENACLVLLITDHLNWDNEFEHLKILQDKINAYVAFIESKQYDEIYPNADFKMAMIEIHFKYDITDSCQKFLQVAQDQLGTGFSQNYDLSVSHANDKHSAMFSLGYKNNEGVLKYTDFENISAR